MHRNAYGLTNEADWENVTPEDPCPICGSGRGCSTHSQVFVSCERISSQWPLTTGAWLHRLELAVTGTAIPARPAPEPSTRAPRTAALTGTRS